MEKKVFEINGKKVTNMSEFFEAMEARRSDITLVNTGDGIECVNNADLELKKIIKSDDIAAILALLSEKPQYAEHVEWFRVFHIGYEKEWLEMLKKQPQLYVYAPSLVELMSLGEDFWEQTILDYPDFADVYPCDLPDTERFALIHKRHPEMVEQAFRYVDTDDSKLVFFYCGNNDTPKKVDAKVVLWLCKSFAVSRQEAEDWLTQLAQKGRLLFEGKPYYYAKQFMDHHQPELLKLDANFFMEVHKTDQAWPAGRLETAVEKNDNAGAVQEIVDGKMIEHHACIHYIKHSKLRPGVKRYLLSCGVPEHLKKVAGLMAPEYVCGELDWSDEVLAEMKGLLQKLPTHDKFPCEFKKSIVELFECMIADEFQPGILQMFLKEVEKPELLAHLDYKNRLMYANMMIHIIQGKLSHNKKFVNDKWFPFAGKKDHSYSYYFDPRHICQPWAEEDERM